VASTLKAVWRTLDRERGEEFREKLEVAVGQGVIRKKVADMLAIAFSELAYHKERTRGKLQMATCYKMTRLGGRLVTTRENALKQLELMVKARGSGAIDSETAVKVYIALAGELEMFHRANALSGSSDWYAQEQLIKQYGQKEIIPGDSAGVAAGIIVEMEDGQLPDLTPAARLVTMKKRVEELLYHGPNGNDWIDPLIRPNVSNLLFEAGLITEEKPWYPCYARSAAPVEARSEELNKLQQKLLDKNVKAGVLDVETAKKISTTNENKLAINYAVEEDIRAYQQKVRRIVRWLYKRGELPSIFVRKIERAVDIDIIDFDSAKSLRNDMGYYFRALLWDFTAVDVIKMLTKRKLIPPARNHLRVFNRNEVLHELAGWQKQQLVDFEVMIDSKDTYLLPGDEKVTIPRWRLGQDNLDYRLKMRKVVRALLKTGLMREVHLKQFEECLGIPIIGKLGDR
jgi:hypothetical protein